MEKDEIRTRIIQHGRGSGTVTPAMVEQRAQELAVLAGRRRDQITDEDREQALHELHGETRPTSTEAQDEGAGEMASHDPSEPVEDSGHRQPDRTPPDDSLSEELVLEGAEEAEHERMVEGRREQIRRTRRETEEQGDEPTAR